MWPRLRQITVLVSVLAAFFGLLWQIKQFRKECPPDQSLPACTICSLLPNEACETDQREDDAAWAAAVRQSTPAGYRDYNLRWPHGRHRPEAAARLRELDERSWARLGRGGIPELRAYLSEWSPDGAHVSEATNRISELEDDDAWSVASGAGSPEAYWQYLNHPWTRHGVQAHKRLDELSEAEWEREIKNSDSEEVIESFINKYKVGSYITLAQERLKVAGAWTPIKNTTDPQVLFDFLSYYHDPIFEKLARNLLQIIDDQTWQLALKKGTRDAFEAYVKKWSAFRPPGRYVEDAENKLNELERTYWDLGEKDPETKCGEASTMYSITEGDIVKFYYEVPSKCMKDLPVNMDTLKFEGKKNGKRYQGKAYVFTKYCGGKSIGYEVSGSENDDRTLITLEGPAPVFDKDRCRVHHLTWDSTNSTLEFKAQIPVEREIKAKAKTRDKPDQIRR